MSRDIFQLIKKSKADFVQVDIFDSISNKILFENQKLKDFSKVFSNYVSVSVWIGKKNGIAMTNTFSEKLIDKAIQIAKSSEDLEFFYGLPKKSKIQNINGLYGGKKDEEEVLESANSLITDLGKKESMPQAVLEYSTFNRRLINSLGVDLEENGSFFDAEVEYLIKDKETISFGDGFSSRKIPSNKEINNFSKKVLEETRELKNPIKLTKIPKVVILEHRALAQLLDSAFLSNFNGLHVLKGKSILAGKEGRKLFSKDLNIKDSGILEGGIKSQNFDGEGFPSQETTLVTNGNLRNFIYDYNISKHLNKKSTGNSTGGGIGFNNIIIGKGKGINEDKVLIIKDIIGAHTCNETTTDFSVKSFGALLLDKGERKAIKDIMLNGKMMEILNNVVGIGKEIKNIGNIYLPKMAFKGIKISPL